MLFIPISWTEKQGADGLKTLAEGHTAMQMQMTLVLSSSLYITASHSALGGW